MLEGVVTRSLRSLARGLCFTLALVTIACEEPRMIIIRDTGVDARLDAATRPDIIDDQPMMIDDRPDVLDDRPSAPDDHADVNVDRADAVDDRPDVVDDRPTIADSGVDSGAPLARCTPTIDGTIGATEYAMAARAENTVIPSAWGANELRELRVCFDDNALYIAVRGSVEPAPMGGTTNSIVIYLDRDFRGGAGGTATGIALFSALMDRSGQLDTALSANFRLTAAVDGFGVEGAFGVYGTRTFTASTSDTTQGWRLFWPAGGMPDRRSDFAYVLSGVNTNCQDRLGLMDDVCETSILWTSLFEGPRPPMTTVALFARIVNADGTMSPDQTLPQDDPTNPRTISRLLTVSVR
jgi:hypothetical protein